MDWSGRWDLNQRPPAPKASEPMVCHWFAWSVLRKVPKTFPLTFGCCGSSMPLLPQKQVGKVRFFPSAHAPLALRRKPAEVLCESVSDPHRFLTNEVLQKGHSGRTILSDCTLRLCSGSRAR